MDKSKSNKVNLTSTITQAEKDYLQRGGKSANQGIIYLIHLIQRLHAEGLKQLKNYFTEDEWVLIAKTLKDQWNVDEPSFICSKSELVRILSESKPFSMFMDIHPEEIVRKVDEELNELHIMAIWMRVMEYWTNDPEGIHLYEWAKF